LSKFSFGKFLHKSYFYLSWNPLFEGPAGSGEYVSNEFQETESQENPFFLTLYKFHPERRAGEDIKEFVDVGSPFKTSRSFVSDVRGKPFKGKPQTYEIHFDDRNFFGNGNAGSYSGPILPVDPAPRHFPSREFTSSNELNQIGATAISLCKPTTPAASVFAALGELVRDGLPAVPGIQAWRESTRISRKRQREAQRRLAFKGPASKYKRRRSNPHPGKVLGEEYLNYQFGLAPTISDARKISEAIRKSDAILKQYERNSGRGVRRRFVFPTTTIEEDFVPDTAGSPYPVGPPLTYFDDWNGVLTGHRVSVIETWFSGSFTYYCPPAKDYRAAMFRQVALANKLLGVLPSPDAFWQLTPWSWAVDWFTNIGDVMSNVSDWADQGLVMQYGYLMQTKRITDTYTLSGIKPRGYDPLAVSLSFTSITKQRVKADPFGFGVSWDGLSPYQLSIAAALGLTRGRKGNTG
jgi:hypothetical protein